ncbi:hypothetical protein VTH82DRAFT_885 [Thermothelomyces myriococcoides]
MRFALATVALAGAVLATEEAQSTFTSYEYVTITSCGPEVTDCPGSSTATADLTTSTIYSTTVRTVSDVVVTETTSYTTVCPVTSTEAAPEESETLAPPEYSGSYLPPPPADSTTLVTAAPVCPTTSVKAITTSITTVIPTVIYETVEVPCATSAPSNPLPPSAGLPPVSSSTIPGAEQPSTTSSPPIVTAGAATFGAPAALAAAAGVFALLA